MELRLGIFQGVIKIKRQATVSSIPGAGFYNPGFPTTNMPHITAEIRNTQGAEQHSWVMISTVHRSLSDFNQKWGKSGGVQGGKKPLIMLNT